MPGLIESLPGSPQKTAAFSINFMRMAEPRKCTDFRALTAPSRPHRSRGRLSRRSLLKIKSQLRINARTGRPFTARSRALARAMGAANLAIALSLRPPRLRRESVDDRASRLSFRAGYVRRRVRADGDPELSDPPRTWSCLSSLDICATGWREGRTPSLGAAARDVRQAHEG
jgi:hypothetical protein